MAAIHIDDGFSQPLAVPACVWRWHGVHQVSARVGGGGETRCRCGVYKVVTQSA